jgi:hypothetical protein
MDMAGIFLVKLLILTIEKKNGRKKTKYITPIDIQIKTSDSVSFLFPLIRKKARITIPAPARNNSNLTISD